MSRTIKLLSTEVKTNTEAINVSSAKLVRVWNCLNTGKIKITHKTALGATVGTITFQFQDELFIQKAPTDTLEQDGGADAVGFTSVAFT